MGGLKDWGGLQQRKRTEEGECMAYAAAKSRQV